MIRLETDLRSLLITTEDGETTSFLYACYTRDCPFPGWVPAAPHGLAPYSRPLRTFVSDVHIKRLEPGVFYRLPEVACKALGSNEELCLIPLNVEFLHIPYVVFMEDIHGRAYVPDQATDVDVEALHTTHLRYGSWVVCGLLRTEQARVWSNLDDTEWFVHSLFNRAYDDLSPSWQPFRHRGRTTIAFDPPLLNSAVEVSRETA
jgi:hypothetical protein